MAILNGVSVLSIGVGKANGKQALTGFEAVVRAILGVRVSVRLAGL